MVLTRKAGESQGWRWESDGRGDFTVSEAADVPRGTRVVLHLKADEGEFLEESRLRRIVQKYSDHIALPIVLGEGDEAETLNTASALWTRSRTEITPEQYKEFYHHVGHAFDDPWLTMHWRAEGKIEYTQPAVRAGATSRSTCSTRTAVTASSCMSGASSSPTRPKGWSRPICASCAAWSTARTCRSTSAARCCSTTRCWRKIRSGIVAPGAGRSHQEGRGRRAGRSLRHLLGKLRRRAQGRPLRGLRAPRADHQAAALPHRPAPRGWCRWTIISAG